MKWLLLALVVGLGSTVGAAEDEDIIIIWSDQGDQILIPLGGGFYLDMDSAPRPEYTEEYTAPDFYKYPGAGYPTN